ncbi:MAG: START-like domain-containing protein, partial [Verrucomicrobiota bacterium]
MRLSTPAGLEEWFADQVNLVENTVYSFSWGDAPQNAKIVASKDLKFIRYKWLNLVQGQRNYKYHVL